MSDERKTPDLRENKMRIMPVGKLLFTMALPLAISMLVQAFYNVRLISYACFVTTSPADEPFRGRPLGFGMIPASSFFCLRL